MANHHRQPVMRIQITSFLVISTILAGCAGQGDSHDDAMPDSPALPALRSPVGMAQDEGSAEPNIAILPDGTLFLTAPVGSVERPNIVEGAAWLWRSQDDGATWEALREPNRVEGLATPDAGAGAFCSCDADVATSADGWTYYTDWWIAGLVGPGNYLVERSPDGGATWESAPVTIPVEEGYAIDRQWITAGADGQVLLTYLQFGDLVPDPGQLGSGMEVRAVRSADHGETWSDSVAVFPRDGGSPLHGHPFLMPDGAFVVPVGDVDTSEYLDDPGAVRVAVSRDAGATWKEHEVARVETRFDGVWPVAGAADEAGNMFVAWSADDGDQGSRVWLAASNDGGVTWSAPTDLSGPGFHALPWVAARGDGTVAVGWYGGDYRGDPADAPADAEWFAFLARQASHDDAWRITQLQDEPVKTGGFCPRGAACPSDRDLLDYLSLAYDQAGRLHGSYGVASGGGFGGTQVHYTAEEIV